MAVVAYELLNMAKKKAQLLSVEEVRKLVAEKREALRKFRFAVTGGRVKNIKEGRALRKEIARALTAVNAQ